MTRRLVTRSTVTALAALALLAVGVVPSQAAASSSNLITSTKSIDGYRSGSAFTNARSQFGFPKSSTQDRTTCTATWMNGVTIVWHRTLPYAKWEKACTNFEAAKVVGNQWRTDKGLRVGASESQLKKLYKSAKSTKSHGYAVWKLDRASGLSLQAWSKGGRVAFFRLVKG